MLFWASSRFFPPDPLLLTPSGDTVMTMDLCLLLERGSSVSSSLSEALILVSLSPSLSPSNSSVPAQSEVQVSWVLSGGETGGVPVPAGGGVPGPGLHWSGCDPD